MKNATVLLVDDEPELLSVLAEQLSSRSFDVVTCAGGREALTTVDSREVDLVITDYRMPEMSGLALSAELRRRKPWLPVIILTGNDHEPDLLKALPEGGFDFLEKPFRFEVLINRVRHDARAGRLLRHAWERLTKNDAAEAARLLDAPWNELADRLEAEIASIAK